MMTDKTKQIIEQNREQPVRKPPELETKGERIERELDELAQWMKLELAIEDFKNVHNNRKE